MDVDRSCILLYLVRLYKENKFRKNYGNTTEIDIDNNPSALQGFLYLAVPVGNGNNMSIIFRHKLDIF
jgi:hypothetical protein